MATIEICPQLDGEFGLFSLRIRVRRLSVLGLPTPPVGKAYCFFSGIAGVTGCEPPVDFGPGVTPALFSVEPLESLAAVESEFGLAPFVGPLPASFVDVEPLVGPLPASAFGCAKAGNERPRATADKIKRLPNADM